MVVPTVFEDAGKFSACCPKLKPFEGCCVLVELFAFVVPHDGAGKLCDRGEACDVNGLACAVGRRLLRGFAILRRLLSMTVLFKSFFA